MAATVIICIAIAALLAVGILSTRKRISVGCCGGSADPAPRRAKVTDRDLHHYPLEKTVEIDGMHCRNCTIRVENALDSLDGVLAKVSLRPGRAEVHMKREIADPVLRRAVSDAGYTVRSIRESAPADTPI